MADMVSPHLPKGIQETTNSERAAPGNREDGIEPPHTSSIVASSPEFDDTYRFSGSWQVAPDQSIQATVVLTILTSLYQGSVDRQWGAVWVEAYGSTAEKPVPASRETTTKFLDALAEKLKENEWVDVVKGAEIENILSVTTLRKLNEVSASVYSIVPEYQSSLEIADQLSRGINELSSSSHAGGTEIDPPELRSPDSPPLKTLKPTSVQEASAHVLDAIWNTLTSCVHDSYIDQAGHSPEGIPPSIGSLPGEVKRAVQLTIGEILGNFLNEEKEVIIHDALGFSLSLSSARRALEGASDDIPKQQVLAPWTDSLATELLRSVLPRIRAQLPSEEEGAPELDVTARFRLLAKLKPVLSLTIMDHALPNVEW